MGPPRIPLNVSHRLMQPEREYTSTSFSAKLKNLWCYFHYSIYTLIMSQVQNYLYGLYKHHLRLFMQDFTGTPVVFSITPCGIKPNLVRRSKRSSFQHVVLLSVIITHYLCCYGCRKEYSYVKEYQTNENNLLERRNVGT